MSGLLLNESPVLIQPSLVRRLGIAEAAIVQQLHYWAQRSTNVHEAHVWVYKTYTEWADEIGLSAKAVRGALGKLRDAGVVIAIQSPVNAHDRTLWWRIDHDVLGPPPGERADLPAGADGNANCPTGQIRTAPGGSSRAGVQTAVQRVRTETTKEKDRAREQRKMQIPDGFPDELRPHAREAMRILKAVAADHPTAKAVWPREVGLVIMAFPRRPLVATAHELARWAVDPPRPIKDVAATYRTFLKGERDLAAVERLADDGTPTSAPAARASNVHPIRQGNGKPSHDQLLAELRAANPRLQVDAAQLPSGM